MPDDGLAPEYKGKLEWGHKGKPNGLIKYNSVLKMRYFGQPVMYVCVFKIRVNGQGKRKEEVTFHDENN
jgi:hypothetical protein